MKLLHSISAAVWLCLALTAAAQDAGQQSDSTGPLERELFETYLDGVMAAQFNDYALAGVSLAVIRNGRPFVLKGYGYANLDTREEVDPARHLFRPGSISKLFTWTAIMQLAEQGRLDLETDANQYLTQFELPDNYGIPITLKHIMTHTAGFEDGGLGYLFSNSVDNLKPLAEVLATYRPAQVREPGVSSAYSNYATAVAGLIVANVSGMPFEAYIERHILEPLGMDRSTFVEPLPERLAADMAVGYATRSGGLEAGGFEFIKNFGPAGALSATADDMAKFMIAHVNDGYYNGARILETETARLMHSRLFSHHPSVAGMAYGFYETKRNGVRFIGHGGDTIAFHSELIINPEDDFGLYLSFNTPEGAQARAAVVNAIIDYFYPGPDPDFRYPVLEGSARRIAEVSGTYRVNRRSYTKLEGLTSMFGDLRNAAGEEGELVNALGRFSEVEPYVFQRQGGHETLVFKADRSGEIRQALLGSIPVMALDKVPLLEQGSIHQLIVLLAVLAAIFVLINAVRNRNQSVPQAISRHARWSLTGSSAILLLFLGSITFVLAANPVDSLIYDFPPAGLGLVLLLPVLFALLAILCGILTVPVWRSASCNLWQRIRFTYVTVVFLALALVLNYWNVLGWNYY